MNILFLFGAGASCGSVDCHPKAPPLGNQLFKELQQLGGIASKVNSELASLFKQDFELGMAKFRDTQDWNTPALLREMSIYFSQFRPGYDNLYNKLITILNAYSHHFVMSTTNYELLIEFSICQTGRFVSYSTKRINNSKCMPVIKLHGSCNFLPDLGTTQLRNITFIGGTTNVESHKIRIAKSAQEILNFCENEDSLAPSIALYAKGKKVPYCPSVVLQQQNQWRNFVKQAAKIFIIGLKVNPEDSHIWEPLKSTLLNCFTLDQNPMTFWNGVRNQSVRNLK